MTMHDDGKRYDTAPIPAGKHAVRDRRKGEGGQFRERRVPRWVYRVIAILAVAALAVLGWYNRANLTPENVLQWVKTSVVGMGVGDGFPKTFSGSTVEPKNFLSEGKNIVFASDTALTVCNSTGKELLSSQHSYADPAVCASGMRVLLYNLGGQEASVETVGGGTVKLSVGQNVLGAALAPNGRSAVVSAADGYCGKMTAYDAAGKVLSYYWFSDYYPTAVALSPDGTKAAVTGVTAQDGVLASAVYVIPLGSGQPVQPAAVCTGNMLAGVFWDTGSTVIAVGNTGAVFLNTASGAKKEYSFGGMQVTAYSSDAGRLALGLMPYEGSRNQKFVVLNSSGSEIYTAVVPEEIRSVSLFGQTAAALADGKLYAASLSSPSSAAKESSAGSDSCAVALKDESSAYILGISEVRLVNIG